MHEAETAPSPFRLYALCRILRVAKIPPLDYQGLTVAGTLVTDMHGTLR